LVWLPAATRFLGQKERARTPRAICCPPEPQAQSKYNHIIATVCYAGFAHKFLRLWLVNAHNKLSAMEYFQKSLVRDSHNGMTLMLSWRAQAQPDADRATVSSGAETGTDLRPQ
jgi:hypothetical protein